MRPQFRSAYGWITSCALTLIIALVGCTETLTDPESTPLFAVTTDEVAVSTTVPDSAVRDTTLIVSVLGDGFDDGSTVDFMIGDVVNDKLKVKSVHYQNKKRLKVELEVAPDAELLLYDVRVTTRRGPKGIGTELFRVVERVKTNNATFVVTSFDATEVDRSLGGDRCTDGLKPCYKISLEYTGPVDSLTFSTARVYSEYFDPELDDSRKAMGAIFPGASESLFPTTPGSFVAYWQGQWTPLYRPGNEEPWEWKPAEMFVNYAPEGEPDMFAFGYAIITKTGGRMSRSRLDDFPNSYALFQGQPARGYMYAVINDFAFTPPITRPKPKVRPAILRFVVRAFSDPNIHDQTIEVHAFHRAKITYPDGHSAMAFMRGMYTGTGDNGHGTIYEVSLTEAGCHEIQVIAMDGYDGVGEHFDDRFVVWDPERDPTGAAPLGVVLDGSGYTLRPGGCGG